MPMNRCDENPQRETARNDGVEGLSEVGEARSPYAMVDAKPIGEVVEVTGEGEEIFHYRSLEFYGIKYELGDFVYLAPEVDENNIPLRRPDVAIIKDITQGLDGKVWITRQWLYRPEQAKKRGGGRWKPFDNREVYHTCFTDDAPANTIMHKCRVHYIPSKQQPPSRSENPGLFVQKVYDRRRKCLFNIEDCDYQDDLQQEIDVLVQKTHEHLRELDIESVHECVEELDIGNRQSELKEGYDDTPAKDILAKFKAATGNRQRDWGLEKLLKAVVHICKFKRCSPLDDKSSSYAASDNMGEMIFSWPDDAISAVTRLEKMAYDSLGTEYKKYKQKILSLAYNLEKNTRLARRLLKKELEPSVILNMSPVELKEGLTVEERKILEPERTMPMEMTDARCKQCNERAGIVEVITAGGSRNWYKLECSSCGYQWYASHDAIYSLTVDTAAVGNVGTAPWATAKFEDVQKQRSPHNSEKPSPDIFLKKTAAYMPTLETQKSFRGKAKAKETNATVD